MTQSSSGARKGPAAERARPLASVFFLFLALALALVRPAAPGELKGLVSEVIDGDSVTLASGSQVRYLGIDCPELGANREPDQPLAREAAAFNQRLVSGKEVSLVFDVEKKDGYARLLAYVYLEDGRFVNGLLVENGLAWVYTKRPNLKMRSRLIALQRRAIEAGRGVWALPPKGPEPFYRAGKSSFIFHRPSCPAARGARGKIFKKRIEAFLEGYAPCRSCSP